MLLSIIVPVYNMAAEEKLNHCLDSLLRQTVDDYEIIAVDDASLDSSAKVLKEYENRVNREHPGRMKVILSAQNHRQGGAKNRGLKMASGEWVGFVDSDDFVDPDMYRKLLNKAEETGADMVGCDYNIVDRYTFDVGKIVTNNTADQTGVMGDEEHKKMILRSGSMVVKIYKREVLKKHDLTFPEGIFYEDNCASPLWSMYFEHFERVEEPLYYYLTVPESTTHHVTWEKCRDRMKAGEILLEECHRRGLMGKYREEIEFRFTELYYVTTLFSYMYSGVHRKPSHTELLREGMQVLLPEYDQNPYYSRMVAAEDQKLISLHKKSNLLFFVWYCVLFGYRKFRKRLRGEKA